jgi:hypothetical protein
VVVALVLKSQLRELAAEVVALTTTAHPVLPLKLSETVSFVAGKGTQVVLKTLEMLTVRSLRGSTRNLELRLELQVD